MFSKSPASAENWTRFALPGDIEECRRLHKLHGTTYYYATQRFKPEIRRQVHALYGFVRVPDEWVDNPGDMSVQERQRKLAQYRSEMMRGYDGVCPTHPVLRAFVDVMHESAIPIEEPLIFLEAMEMDLTVRRYETYEALQRYMRGSASAVGVMMCHVLGSGQNQTALDAAMKLGEAMQLTNFLRDVGEDLDRDRIYLPLEDLDRFRVTEDEVMNGVMSDRFVALMKFEIERARQLYAESEPGILLLPKEARKAVKLGLVLYSRILDRIERRNYDVFGGRARTSTTEKAVVAAQVVLGLR